MPIRQAALTGALVMLAANSALATNGYLPHGFGTKSKGMAGAGSALPQDAMITTTNVAGGVWVGRRLDAGLALFSPDREYTQNATSNQFPPEAIAAGMAPPWPSPIGSNPDFSGTVESDKDLFLIPHFAYVHPLDERNALGVALYGNGGMNTTYQPGDTTALPGTPGSAGLGTFGGALSDPADARTGVDLAQLGLNLSYSRKLTEQFSVGVGAILAYQMFKGSGLSPFGMLAADGNPDDLSNRGRDGAFGWGAQIGALWQPTERLSLAASYQTQIDFGRFEKYADMFAEEGDLDAPAILNLGLAWRARPDLVFAFDVQRIWYGDIDAFANPMSESLLRCMGGETQYCLGGDRGVGFGWDDMTVYKLGVQWDARPDLTLRAGYSMTDQPVPEEGVLFNTLAPAVIEQHFTLGLTKRFGKRTELNLAAMYAPQNDLDCGCQVPFSGGPESINIAMDQWEIELGFGYRW